MLFKKNYAVLIFKVHRQGRIRREESAVFCEISAVAQRSCMILFQERGVEIGDVFKTAGERDPLNRQFGVKQEADGALKTELQKIFARRDVIEEPHSPADMFLRASGQFAETGETEPQVFGILHLLHGVSEPLRFFRSLIVLMQQKDFQNFQNQHPSFHFNGSWNFLILPVCDSGEAFGKVLNLFRCKDDSLVQFSDRVVFSGEGMEAGKKEFGTDIAVVEGDLVALFGACQGMFIFGADQDESSGLEKLRPGIHLMMNGSAFHKEKFEEIM